MPLFIRRLTWRSLLFVAALWIVVLAFQPGRNQHFTAGVAIPVGLIWTLPCLVSLVVYRKLSIFVSAAGLFGIVWFVIFLSVIGSGDRVGGFADAIASGIYAPLLWLDGHVPRQLLLVGICALHGFFGMLFASTCRVRSGIWKDEARPPLRELVRHPCRSVVRRPTVKSIFYIVAIWVAVFAAAAAAGPLLAEKRPPVATTTAAAVVWTLPCAVATWSRRDARIFWRCFATHLFLFSLGFVFKSRIDLLLLFPSLPWLTSIDVMLLAFLPSAVLYGIVGFFFAWTCQPPAGSAAPLSDRERRRALAP